MINKAITQRSNIIKWIKKIGFWGFMFFLAKGLVWLAIGYWFVK